MASELRVNTSSNRVGLGTITYTDTGPIISGITTGNNFKTGTTNVHSTGVELVNINTAGATATFGGDLSIPDTIVHTGDTNTKIRFPAADVFTTETGGSERLRCDSDGVKVQNGRFYSAGTFAYIDSSSTSNASLTLKKTTGGADAIDYLQLRNNANALLLKIGGDGTIYSPDVLASHEGDTNTKIRFPAADTFSVETAGSERFRIKSDGKIDVGGNENAYKFNIIDESNRTTTAETALLLYAKHDGSGTTGAGFGTGIRFWGDRASGNIEQNMGRIMCTAEVNSGTTLSGALSFETSVAGSLAERLRITSGGSVNIGGNYTQTAYMAQIAGDLLLQKSQAAYQHPQIELYNSSNTAHGGSIKFSGHHSGSKFEEAVIKGYGGTGSGTGSLVIATGNGTDKFRLHSTGQLELKNGSFSHNVDCVMANSGTMEIGAGSIIKFRTATNNVLTIDANGHTIPGGYNGAKDLGSSSYRWRNVYTSDIDLCNESRGGNEVDGTWGAYTIQEGEDDLFLINRRSGKKYKFNLTEVS